MATQGLSPGQLLTCSDADFDNNIKDMSVKGLMELISTLQKEMAKEQENFNSLSSSLQGLRDRNSRQYKTINRDMMASQTRLTTLMNRSMKCFSQQNVQQTNQGTGLRRRNSAKSAENPNTSPSKSTGVQRSQSIHAINQPSTDPDPTPNPSNFQPSTLPTSRPASAHVVLRGGVNRALVNRGVTQQQQRPASIAGVNGVATNSNNSNNISNASSTARVGSTSGASSSTTSLNIQPQPMVMGVELTSRSKSQIIITPSVDSQPPPASPQPSPSQSNTQQGYAGLPSVRHLAQTFGSAKPSAIGNAGGQAGTNYRPVIRAQSVASADTTRSMDNIHLSSASSKVNGLSGPIVSVGGRIQGQYIKRNTAPKPPVASTVGSQSELELVHARLRASRETTTAALPNKPSAPVSTTAAENGVRETSVFTTNLDRKKSSSSILLGRGGDFAGDASSPRGARQLSEVSQLNPLRKAQSREELYAIESRTRLRKNALLKEIENKQPSVNGGFLKTTSFSKDGKGASILAQRLEQDQKEKEQTATTNSQNMQPKTRVYVQLQPAVPDIGGGGAGTGRVAVSINSSQQARTAGSRENLAEQSQDKAVSRSQDNRITPASTSSSSSVPPTSAPVTITQSAAGGKSVVTLKSANTAGASSVTATPAAAATTKLKITTDQGVELEGEENTPRMNLRAWDPKPVLDQLYAIRLMEETVEDISHQFISMEGLMEKLPMNKKKSTLLKTWKRRFFQAKDGWMKYYETSNRDKPSETLQLMGGHVDDMGNRILGIDDGRGNYLMVRAPTDKEYGQWKVALESQTADNTRATYIRPVMQSPPHPTKRVVVIDMGSSAIRAGILGEEVSLPQVFFPSVVAVDKTTGKKVVGVEAYHPDIRHNSTILHPIRPSNKVDQAVMKTFNIEVDMMSAIFGKVFSELKVNPKQYYVMLSTPQTLSDSLRSGLMNALVESLGVQGVCMVQQSLLALYSYRTTTGIIVDIGQRIEILPIYDGFVIEGGVARCPYGSQKVIDSLKKSLLETNYKFASEVELLLVRYIMEQSCYAATSFHDEEMLCSTQPGKLMRPVPLNKFHLPEGAYKSVDVEEGRFVSPEGFFNVDLWEMDYPTLHKLIFHAIQSCPMDNRRHMYRAVYLSGGVTMLPGFIERLHTELRKLAPPAVTVEVHASPQRYHAAYLGACSVAGMPQFQDMAISQDEWRRDGARAFRKWQAPTS